MIATESDVRTKAIRRTVCLEGINELLFDRYPGDNSTKLEWHQKVYLRPGTSQLCIPATNIVSALSSHNTNSFPKRLRDKRKYKDICNACLSFVVPQPIDPSHGSSLLLLRDGKPIELGKPDQERDEKSGLYLHRAVARLEKGIPNPKERACLPCPWELRFVLMILQNKEVKEQEIRNLFEEGGLAIGLGTWRGVYGKFIIKEWS